MAIFKKTETHPQKTRERPSPNPPAKNVSGEAAISIIGPAMRVVGDLTTDGTVRVEGEVEGVITAARGVILGQGGVIIGGIVTADAVIAGTVDGSIQATNRLELQSTSTVRGEIRMRAEHLSLEEGARFEGKVNMIAEGTSLEGPAAPPALSAGTAPSDPAADGLQLSGQSSHIDDAEKVQTVASDH